MSEFRALMGRRYTKVMCTILDICCSEIDNETADNIL